MTHASYEICAALRATLDGKLSAVPHADQPRITAFLQALADFELDRDQGCPQDELARELDFVDERRLEAIEELSGLIERGPLHQGVLTSASPKPENARPISPELAAQAGAKAVLLGCTKSVQAMRDQSDAREQALLAAFDDALLEWNESQRDPFTDARQVAYQKLDAAMRSLLAAVEHRDRGLIAIAAPNAQRSAPTTAPANHEKKSAVIATPSTVMPLGARLRGMSVHIKVVAPRSLRPHHRNRELFPPESENQDRYDALLQHVRKHGVQRPLLVAGERCASAPGTILGGHRRHRAALEGGLREVPVVMHDGLNAADEHLVMLLDNHGDQHGRKLTPRQRAELERQLSEALKVGRGRRTDLVTSVKNNQGSAPTPADASGKPTAMRNKVAAETGTSASAVTARQVVFYSPISTAALHQAVDAGKIKLNPAADIVRTAQRAPEVSAALKALTAGKDTAAEQAVMEDAKRRVDAALQKRLSTPRKKRAPRGSTKRRPAQARTPVPASTSTPTASPSPRWIHVGQAPEPLLQAFERLTTEFEALADRYSTVAAKYLHRLTRAVVKGADADTSAVLEAWHRAHPGQARR
ncbi:ParB N-terminal domain-containing protein [Sorangium sp. So ce124]|uniref:ParB N-terminal domain-containing protein n=1 Tax=Sorangium sp. So ce124 TaxID=3133280 RepID=UPI003F603005